MTDQLPPLPRQAGRMPWEDLRFGKPGFTADQMREYAAAAVLAEREACAKVCEDIVFDWHKHAAGGPVAAYNACAAAIRARSKHGQ